jgi:hypothetical protein
MLNRVAILSGLSLLLVAAGFVMTKQFIRTQTTTERPEGGPQLPSATTAPAATPPPASPQHNTPVTWPPPPKVNAPPAAVEPTPAAPVSPVPQIRSAAPEKTSTPAVTAPAVENVAPAVETPMPLRRPPITLKEAESGVPAWLKAHVGEGVGQIAQVVLQRARALYLQKVSEGVVKNSCYFAMDATRPNDFGDGKLGRRFYIICEPDRSFRAISAGHGSGRNLKGVADFKDGRRCAKNFSNAMDSKLTAGGAYVTREIKTSFKGYYRVSTKKDAVLLRSFIQFDGEGEVANARQREIGGHAAELLRNVCLRKNPHSPYANHDGYVPFGKLVDYASGRSDGCTSWTLSDAQKIITMVKDNPTTLYIYPESNDINAVAQAVKAGRSLSYARLYWDASCLKAVHSPKFWPKEILEPILAQYKKDHPMPPPQPTPICKTQ